MSTCTLPARTTSSSGATYGRSMNMADVKVVHFIRHGEAEHNVAARRHGCQEYRNVRTGAEQRCVAAAVVVVELATDLLFRLMTAVGLSRRALDRKGKRPSQRSPEGRAGPNEAAGMFSPCIGVTTANKRGLTISTSTPRRWCWCRRSRERCKQPRKSSNR